jgi:hypothetical protein
VLAGSKTSDLPDVCNSFSQILLLSRFPRQTDRATTRIGSNPFHPSSLRAFAALSPLPEPAAASQPIPVQPRLEIENPSSLGILQNIYLIFIPQQSSLRRVQAFSIQYHTRRACTPRTPRECSQSRSGDPWAMVAGLRATTAFPTGGRFAQDLSANTKCLENRPRYKQYSLNVYWVVSRRSVSQLKSGVRIMHQFILELLSSITPQHHDSLSDTLKGDELLVAFPIIVHKSNTHIVCRLSTHGNW